MFATLKFRTLLATGLATTLVARGSQIGQIYIRLVARESWEVRSREKIVAPASSRQKAH